MNITYENISNPDTARIMQAIAVSDMSTKDVTRCQFTPSNSKLKFTFGSDFQSGDEATLQDIIEFYENYVPKEYKITEQFNDPTNLNINLFGLYKEELIDEQGFLYEKNYYKDIVSGGEFEDLVVKDEYEYFTNAYDLVTHRIETITWYLEDDAIGKVKILTKYYCLGKAIREGIRRRTNLINKAKCYLFSNVTGIYDVSGEPTMPNSYYLFTLCSNEVDLYINGMKDYLVEWFENTDESYITEEIRSGVIDIIKYWSGA